MVTTMTASTPVHDCSYVIANIRENHYQAIILISTVIPMKNLTCIDVTATTSSPKSTETYHSFEAFLDVYSIIKSNVKASVYAFLETDCKKNVVSSLVLSKMSPEFWQRFSISSFGFTTFFFCHAPIACKLIKLFTSTYLSKTWSESNIDIEFHKKFVNVLLRTSISSTILPRPIPSSERLVPCIHN